MNAMLNCMYKSVAEPEFVIRVSKCHCSMINKLRNELMEGIFWVLYKKRWAQEVKRFLFHNAPPRLSLTKCLAKWCQVMCPSPRCGWIFPTQCSHLTFQCLQWGAKQAPLGVTVEISFTASLSGKWRLFVVRCDLPRFRLLRCLIVSGSPVVKAFSFLLLLFTLNTIRLDHVYRLVLCEILSFLYDHLCIPADLSYSSVALTLAPSRSQN